MGTLIIKEQAHARRAPVSQPVGESTTHCVEKYIVGKFTWPESWDQINTFFFHYFEYILKFDIIKKLAGFFSFYYVIFQSYLFLLVAVEHFLLVNWRCVLFNWDVPSLSVHTAHMTVVNAGAMGPWGTQQATCVHITTLKDLLKLCYFQLWMFDF